MQSNFPELEQRVLERWKAEKTFAQTLEKTKGGKPFVFYEGPPTANGKPGIHHVLARAFKDVICRFKTMQGFFVERKAGWDTHGLPVELAVEKKLGLKNKKDIEAYGIGKFNAECKKGAGEYIGEWERLTERMGYWLDMEHPYSTYDAQYVESLWAIIKTVWDRGFLYQGHKVVPHCPRCQTSLSSHEVAQGYKKVKENSVYVKFELVDEPGTFVLAWTTTPWTLPGNVALAVGPEVNYKKIESRTTIDRGLKNDGELHLTSGFYIIAEDRISSLIEEGNYFVDLEKAPTIKGSELVGKKYKPLFDFVDLSKDNNKAYTIVPADFVTTEEGTGVVHTAVMYGVDDYELGEILGLPKIHTVAEDGKFNELVKPWVGWKVKDKELANEKKTTDAIVTYLKDHNKLLIKELYEHDYPFCWRCDTPLLYYAKNSWFITMSALRDKLLESNATINWVPAHLREGRFGEWLREVKDWAFSRERYWGTPLPIWECANKHRLVIGSYDELQKHTKPRNVFFAIRHGEAETNATGILSSWPETVERHLTEQGKAQVADAGAALAQRKFDLIISSPLLRTKETAAILSRTLGVSVEYDDHLREIGLGAFNGKTEKEYHAAFGSELERFTKSVNGTETLLDVRSRALSFLERLNARYEGKTIVLVSHGDVIWQLQAALEQKDSSESLTMGLIEPAEYVELTVSALPRDATGSVNPHRPYIDNVTLMCPECSTTMTRVKEVCDGWFDSGSMPFAAGVAGYPADYISEAIDQTRGWFYTLLAVATLLDKPAPFKNVICLGHILDAKGQKMSKHIGNVVDPWTVMDKHGADALRFHFFTMNQPGDTKLFDEKNVGEVVRKTFMILWNVVSFWEQFVKGKRESEKGKGHILDEWLEARTNLMILNVTNNLAEYDVTKAGRRLHVFIEELSTQYLRASRKRLQGENGESERSRFVFTQALKMVAVLLAPFTPFFAEMLSARLGRRDSVHLAEWPNVKEKKRDEWTKVHKQMKDVWNIVEVGRSLREESNIKLRQPLQQLVVVGVSLGNEPAWPAGRFGTLLLDELNVREVHAAKETPSGSEWVSKADGTLTVALDTTMTDELVALGWVREITRNVNDARKKGGLKPSDAPTLAYATDDARIAEVFERFGDSIKKGGRLVGLEKRDDITDGVAFSLGEGSVTIVLD